MKKSSLPKILTKFSFLILLLAGFFIFIPKSKAETINHLIISEIQITGGSGQTTNDFIELYNPTNTAINLKGYRLVKRTKTGINDSDIKSFTKDEFIPAYGFYLWANSNYISIPILPNATTTATIANDNGIALRFGKADEGEIIDALAWGEAENIFIETATFPNNPEVNQSIERNLVTKIFTLQASPSPQNSQSSTEPPLAENLPPESTPAVATSTPSAITPTPPPSSSPQVHLSSPSDIVINEFVADPADEEVEWIELYNLTAQAIKLDGWTLEDNTEKPQKLDGLSIEPKNFLLLNKGRGFSFSINNSGDIIILKNPEGTIIDQVSYGNYDDGKISDNAPFASDPYSIARITDGYDTNNDANDFKLTFKPTKNGTNLITEKNEENIYSTEITINELLPNPLGLDNENEFIELKNIGDSAVDLLNWQIGDNSKTIYTISADDFKSTIIPSQGFFILYRKKTKIALNNTGGDKITLYNPAEKIADAVEYSDAAKEGQSYNKNKAGKWLWSAEITPEKENIITQPNQKPTAMIGSPEEIIIGEEAIFDASDSYDPNGDNLLYLWTLENGLTDDRPLARYTFKKSGSYRMSLKVKDLKGGEDETKIMIEVLEKEDSAKINLSGKKDAQIYISEFLPNPQGDETGEWIEIYNNENTKINLINWIIDDEEGGSKPYKISRDLFIEAKNYLLLKRTETKIALNNEGDEVRLFNPDNKIISSVNYLKAPENYSYALDENQKWQWTEILTPLEENIISLPADEVVGIEEVVKVSLEEAKNLDNGDLVKVEGMVAVEPGILSSQIFYLNGMQIYCNKKDFPNLKIGGLVEVTGEISEASGEKRIKIKNKDNIKILQRQSPLSPKEIIIGELDESLKGFLVKVKGQLIEKSGANLYLDDGNEEIKIYLKALTGIKIPAELIEGDYLEVTGFVSEAKSGWQILPRYQNDLIVTKKLDSQEYLPGSINSAVKSQGQSATKYLILTIIALVVIIIGLLFRKKE